jgi:diguanylate cyclase (GGDEF)-like protein
MIVVSATVNTYVLYALKDGRGAFLLIYLVSMLFGVFRLSSQQLLRITAFVLLSYALVIWQLARHNPATLNLSVELLQWVVLAFVLVWFSLMGGYINTLVTRLGQSEADELTGAYTRRRIIEILRHEKLRCDRGAGPLSVCMVDIDKLKQVNDTYGHQRGDEFLRAVVSAVQEELRVVDYIGRYGGDEFLLVLTQTPLVGAVDCAERIRSKVERQAVSESSPALAPSVSIGVAEYEMGETTIQTVVRADRALYRAKSGGRNRIECASSSIEQGGSAQQAL